MGISTTAISALLQGATESIVCLSPELRVMAFNEALRRNFYDLYRKEIKAGDDYKQYILPGTWAKFEDYFGQALQGQSVSFRDRVWIWNRYVWYESHMTPFKQGQGPVEAVTMTFRDVDLERKSIKKAAQLATTLNAIFENTKDSILLLDQDFKILNCNTRAQYSFQMASNRIPQIGDDLRPFIFKGLEDEFLARFSDALEGRGSVTEVAAQSFDGQSFWFQTKFNPVYSENNALLGVSLFARPITDKKKAELALQENEERFRKVIQSSPISIFILDESSKWVEINQHVTKAYGYTLENLAQTPLSAVFPKDWEKLEQFALRPFLEDEDPVELVGNEIVLLRSFQGNWYSVEVSLSAFLLNQRKHWVMLVQDVSKREADARLISEQYQKLSQIAWKQSHVIRSAVAKIAGIVYILGNDEQMKEEEKKEWIQHLQNSTDELDNYVKEIVTWTESSHTLPGL